MKKRNIKDRLHKLIWDSHKVMHRILVYVSKSYGIGYGLTVYRLGLDRSLIVRLLLPCYFARERANIE